MEPQKQRESFGSRLGFILVSAGCAIGIGNVWRFPTVTGQNGGGIFVLFYLIFLVLMGLPAVSYTHLWHKKIKEDPTIKVVVAPSFRPDKVLNIRKEGFADYIHKLEDVYKRQSIICLKPSSSYGFRQRETLEMTRLSSTFWPFSLPRR